MKKCKKMGLLVGCLIGFATSVQAQIGGSKMPDGSWILDGRRMTIGDTDYICRGNVCETPEQAIRRMESYDEVDVSYMTDLAEEEAIDRYTISDEKIDMNYSEHEDTTPALGKVQNKLNELGSEVFGLIGL